MPIKHKKIHKHVLIYLFVFSIATVSSCVSIEDTDKLDPILRDSTIVVHIDTTLLQEIGAFNSYYHDSLGFGHPVLFVDTLTVLPIDHLILLLKPDELQTPLILFPGDTVEIRIHAETKRTYLTSADPIRRNELAILDHITAKTGSIFPAFYSKMVKKANILKDYNNLLRGIDSLKLLRQNILTAYSKNNEVSDVVPHFVARLVEDAAWLDSLSMLGKNRKASYLSSDLVNEQLRNWEDDFGKRSSQAIKGYAEIGLALVELGTDIKYIDTGKQFITKVKYSVGNFSGDSRNFLVNRFLQEVISKKNPTWRCRKVYIVEDDKRNRCNYYRIVRQIY